MNEVCINRLDIKGKEENIKEFLNDFKSDNGFKMENIVPYNCNFSDTWRHTYWGPAKELFNCSSYSEVMGSYKEEDNQGVVSITYSTLEVPNEVFCQRASKKYPELIFKITYYEPTELFAGRSAYKNGYEIPLQSKFYERDEEDLDDSIIHVYEFAIEEDFTSVAELINPLKRASEKVRNHFQRKVEEDIVLDFNDLRKEYLENGDE